MNMRNGLVPWKCVIDQVLVAMILIMTLMMLWWPWDPHSRGRRDVAHEEWTGELLRRQWRRQRHRRETTCGCLVLTGCDVTIGIAAARRNTFVASAGLLTASHAYAYTCRCASHGSPTGRLEYKHPWWLGHTGAMPVSNISTSGPAGRPGFAGPRPHAAKTGWMRRQRAFGRGQC